MSTRLAGVATSALLVFALASCAAPAGSAAPPTAATTPSAAASSAAPVLVDNTVPGRVAGGITALPLMDIPAYAAVPKGWAAFQLGAVTYSVPASWNEVPDPAQSAYVVDNSDGLITAEQVSTMVRMPYTGSPWGDQTAFLGHHITGQGSSEGAWGIPADTVSWRLAVPGTTISGVDIWTEPERTQAEVFIEIADSRYHLYFRVPPGDDGLKWINQFIGSLSVAP